MEVIKKGWPQKGWTSKFTCSGKGNGGGGCGAVLLVSERDLYYTHSHHYDGSSETYKTFTCCECGVETDITAPVIPKGKRPKKSETSSA